MKDIITIDGPAGAGKSTVARFLAKKLGYKYLDTGALYRAVAWKVRKKKVNPEDKKNLCNIIGKTNITLKGKKIMLNGTDVTSRIRHPDIEELSSKVSAKPIVRKLLFKIQRQIGLKGKVVIEGRDIGTAIFPEAKNKFFLDASPEERGKRRYKELKENGVQTTLKATIEGIKKRDKRDSTREDSPLKKSNDMVYIDTTNLTIEEVVKKMMEALKSSQP